GSSALGAVQARAAAVGAGAFADVLAQLLAHGRGLGLAVAAIQVRDDALEPVLALRAAARIVDVGEGDDLVAAAVEHGIARLLVQLLPGRVDAEDVVLWQRPE